MARIKMPAARSKAQEITFEEAFNIFLTDSAARGLAEKTLKTYRNHLHCISLYFDISTPLGKLSRNKMNEMVVAMRESGLATNSISSYVRVTSRFNGTGFCVLCVLICLMRLQKGRGKQWELLYQHSSEPYHNGASSDCSFFCSSHRSHSEKIHP